MTFEPIEKLRAHERVVVQIEQSIADGKFVPGDRFPSERELVEQFDISRPTVREGLRVAESLGLIEVRPGNPNGSIITAHYPKGLARVIEGVLRGRAASLEHVVEMRMLLEGQASFYAAQQGEAAVAPLREALEQMRRAANLAELEAADLMFHEAQGAASGNPLIALMVVAMRDVTRATINVGLPSLGWPDARDTATERHGAILAAVEAGDGETACRVARANLMATYEPLVGDSADRLRALVTASPAALNL